MLSAIRESRIELKQAENRYHLLFDEAPMGILLINPETMVAAEFNEQACNQLGYSPEEFAKLRISDYQGAETLEEIIKRIDKISKEGKDHFETKHRSRDGELHDVMVDVRIIELSGCRLMLCTYHDITDIKNVETALMDSEEKYRLLIELAQEGVWALNSDYETVFVNPQMPKCSDTLKTK